MTAIESQSDIADLQATINQLSEENAKLWDMAYKDHLTGLYNRRYFEDYLGDTLPCGDYLGIADLNRFKEINDTRGHAFGDRILKSFAVSINHITARYGAYVVRLGGDEFLLSHIRNTDIVEVRILVSQWKKFGVTTSIGFAPYNGSLTSTMAAADQTMYKNKKALSRNSKRGLGDKR